jgi:predicted nucleotide-binding protein (sugar kinase/HSP70/actin superfamily)
VPFIWSKNSSANASWLPSYGVDCIPQDFLPTGDVDIAKINDNMFWSLGRHVLGAATIVGENPNLDIIYITNFKCGPDSFVKHFTRPAAGKPFLTLQFDGHSNDAGVMTRCEAYLDSKGILRPHPAKSQPQTNPAAI